MPETTLIELGFQLHTPSHLLQPYVRSYWTLQRNASLRRYHEEYMHPRGGFGVVFNFGDPLWVEGAPLLDPVFLDGANTVSRRIGLTGHLDLLGIRFAEGGAYPFLAIPLHELRDQYALLDILDRAELVRLHTRLQMDALAARLRLLDGWLLDRLARGKERSPLVPASLARLREAHGSLSIPELARQLAVGQRQLERVYQSQVGLSPKRYARLLRIEAARLRLKRLGDDSIARVAMELDYYDQAHFVRDFKAVVGLTPQGYVKRQQGTS
jgi:AraC-like DNA-binding protein